jgi:serine/threonine-protein kinase
VLRREQGEAVDQVEYLRRFPHWAGPLQAQFEVEAALDHDTQLVSDPTGSRPASPTEGFLPPPLPGYEVLGLLGRGNMGVVYQARQTGLNRLVALKMILAGEHAQPDELARFRREAEAVARLHHPNIVQIYEVGEAEGRPYFSLEFLDGGNPADKLAGTPLAAQPAAQMLETLARAVQAAHQCGIVHRDLKPANVLLTADGTPKIADFGLAKHLPGEPGASAPGGQSQSGAIVGTPCYMAPEQALGSSAAAPVGPAADVYALGAVFYEMLTGRPPFQGATVLDTLEQVKSQEPVPPTRLQPKVPRDLETICLKCLQKSPARRYASALALAEDLSRFQAGEPIRARPVGRLEKALKWVKRRPAAAALWAVGLLAVVLGGAGVLWWQEQEATRLAEEARRETALRQGVEAALSRATDAQQEQARWGEAGAILNQAANRVGDAGPADLRRRVAQARADLLLVAQLDAARLKAVTIYGGEFDFASAERDYATAFRQARLGRPGDDVKATAARVRNSVVKAQLVAALDDWAWVTGDRRRCAWLLAVARRADPDPWRDRFRDPKVWQDRKALEQLAAVAPVAKLSPQLLMALGAVLQRREADALPLLRAAQGRYPQDFWLNLGLGNALLEANKPAEAVGYYRAALALRPQSYAVHSNLGNALQHQGDLAGAGDCFRRALELDRGDARVHNNLGTILYAQGDLAGAIACHRKAIALNPRYAIAHNNLGRALYRKGDVAGAIACYHKAIQLTPRLDRVHTNLGIALHGQGDVPGATACFKKALAVNPRNARAHIYLGLALYAQRDVVGASACFKKAIALDPRAVRAHTNLGITLLAQGDLSGAVAAFTQAIALDPRSAKVHTHLGLALLDQGKVGEAIACCQKALALDSRSVQAHGALGLALLRQGRFAEAGAATRRALALFPLTRPQRRYLTEQLRTCEQFRQLEAQLPALVQGKTQPQNAAHRLALGELCLHYKKRYAIAARFYTEAFTANPKLAEDLSTGNRYRAACAAALAAGQGSETAPLADREKARLRRQALLWLRADLAAWTRLVEKGPAQAKALVQRTLIHWQKDAALAGIRDAAWIVNLPADELRACRQLWADVAALLDRAGERQ